MTLTLYQMTSENNKIGKTKTLIGTYNITLREESSLLYPKIRLAVSSSTVANANYMYIAEYGRYYFITDIISVRNGVVEIAGTVDVLETYSSEILNLDVVIDRQQYVGDFYLPDNDLSIFANPHIVTKEFPSGFTNESLVLLCC